MPATPRIEPHVGQVFEPRPVSVDESELAAYRAGLDVPAEPNPPQMYAGAWDAGNGALFSQQRGHLWLRQEWELHQPIREGVTYTASGRVVDIYPRRERTILLTETEVRDPSGALVSIQRHHQSFLLDQPPTGEVQLRAPSEKEGARASSGPPPGDELGVLERTVTLEMCGLFFHGSRSYHSDKEQSQALGFQDVVVGGRMSMGLVGEVLDRSLGERWATSGLLLVKFTNVLWPGEPIRVTARTTGPLVDDPARTGVYAWVEKADSTVVLVAEGSVAS